MGTLEILGKRIQMIRERRALTQEGLEDLTGINAKYISSVERGQKNATVKTLKKIADGLGLELYELFLFSENDNPEEAARKAIDSLLKEVDAKTLYLCLNFLLHSQSL